jgi:UDP-glucose 4-epimerase
MSDMPVLIKKQAINFWLWGLGKGLGVKGQRTGRGRGWLVCAAGSWTYHDLLSTPIPVTRSEKKVHRERQLSWLLPVWSLERSAAGDVTFVLFHEYSSITITMSGFAAKDDQVYLLFGKNGWIGGMLTTMLRAQGKTVHLADSRTEDRAAVLAEIEKYKPTHILNAAGVTGRPNVDWCEANRVATIRANVIGSLTIADICEQLHLHHCLFATGCIFEYDDEHVIGGKGFTEEDTPNFDGSFYSKTKGYVEQMLKEYPNTLTLRGETIQLLSIFNIF